MVSLISCVVPVAMALVEDGASVLLPAAIVVSAATMVATRLVVEVTRLGALLAVIVVKVVVAESSLSPPLLAWATVVVAPVTVVDPTLVVEAPGLAVVLAVLAGAEVEVVASYKEVDSEVDELPIVDMVLYSTVDEVELVELGVLVGHC